MEWLKERMWISQYLTRGDEIYEEIYKHKHNGMNLEIKLRQIQPYQHNVVSQIWRSTGCLKYFHETEFSGENAYIRASSYVEMKKVELECIVDKVCESICKDG